MSQYVDPKKAAASYRPTSGSMSPGLKRARAPYLFWNALTGVVLGAFAVTVWAYSISAVKQDVFDDIDEEARALQNQGPQPGHSASRDQLSVGVPLQSSTSSTVDEAILAGAATAEAISNVPLKGAPATSPIFPSVPRRGILQSLDSRFPKLLDPVNKTLVWGAPPVDDMGTITSSKSDR